MKKKAIVTGCNGLLGTHISLSLYQGGYDVTGIDIDTHSDNLPIKCYEIDLQEKKLTEKLLSIVPNVDLIVHTAAILDNIPKSIDVNIYGTFRLLQYALRAHCEKFIYLSSIPVIGEPSILPITETHPVTPSTLYHTTKYAGELLLNLPEYKSLHPTIFRISSPVGWKMRENRIISVFLNACAKNLPLIIYGSGGRRQNYIDISDITSAIMLGAKAQNATGLFLIGGHTISNKNLAEICVQVTGKNNPIICNGILDPEENIHWEIDISRANQLLGYSPLIQIEDSISALWSNYLKQGRV